MLAAASLASASAAAFVAAGSLADGIWGVAIVPLWVDDPDLIG